MSGFCFDLAKMVGYHSRNTDDEIQIYQMPGTLIFHQREKLAKTALEAGAEAILWIDSDMRFPADTLERLLSHNVEICGVNATTRVEPIKPTALDLEMIEGNPVFHKVETRGKDYVEEISAVGFGVTLTRRSVFEKMAQPWFDILWTDAGGIIGEDVHFCIKAQDYGVKTYVDHVLSPFIKHIGTKEYSWDDVKWQS
jgi:GT2 family glycosyltransferase